MVVKNNILYISYDGLTDPLGQSQILPYIIGLTQSGYNFTILSFEKPDRYAKMGRTIADICTEHGLTWKPLEYTKRPPIISTLRDIQNLLKTAQSLETSFDLIHCRSYIPALAALKLRKALKAPFIFDMRGFWADERVDGKIWSLRSPVYNTIYKYFKRKERDFIEKSQSIVSLTYAGKNEMESWYNTKKLYGGSEDYYNFDRLQAFQNKSYVIPCAADTAFFDETSIRHSTPKWLGAVHGIEPDREYLGYVGSMGTWYMADEMLNLYNHLRKSRPELRFLILSHDDLTTFKQRAIDLGIPQSFIIQIAAERREVPALMSLMTVSVFFILPAYSKKASSPTKQGELMAMGVPIICNDNVGDTGEIIRKYGAGHVVNGFTETDFEEVAQKWEEIKAIDKNQIRHGALEYFSLEKGVKKYAEIYASILE